MVVRVGEAFAVERPLLRWVWGCFVGAVVLPRWAWRVVSVMVADGYTGALLLGLAWMAGLLTDN